MPNLLDLSNKKILITGGAGAIGRVVVGVLAAHGATVIANDIVPAADAHAALPDAANVRYMEADATDAAEVERLFAAMEQTVGLPDVVCCHTGMVGAYPVQEYPLAEFDSLMALNVRSSFVIAQTAAKRWIATGTPGLLLTYAYIADPTRESGSLGLPVVVKGQDLLFIANDGIGDRLVAATVAADATEWDAHAEDFSAIFTSLGFQGGE